MEYFVYYDDGEPWMSIRSFGDDKTEAQGFIKDEIKRDPEKRNVKVSEFLSMLREGGKEYEGPVLVLCDCSNESEYVCYEKLCNVLMTS